LVNYSMTKKVYC